VAEILAVSKTLLTALAVFPVILAVWWSIKAIRRSMEK
jgi:uncharacterized membrane-anchored protein